MLHFPVVLLVGLRYINSQVRKGVFNFKSNLKMPSLNYFIFLCMFSRGKAIQLPALPIPSLSEREPKDARPKCPPLAFWQQPLPGRKRLDPKPGRARRPGCQTPTQTTVTQTDGPPKPWQLSWNPEVWKLDRSLMINSLVLAEFWIFYDESSIRSIAFALLVLWRNIFKLCWEMLRRVSYDEKKLSFYI